MLIEVRKRSILKDNEDKREMMVLDGEDGSVCVVSVDGTRV